MQVETLAHACHLADVQAMFNGNNGDNNHSHNEVSADGILGLIRGGHVP